MPEITAEAKNVTATSADVTYAVTFPEGYTNTKVTVNGDAAEASATLNLTGLTPKTAYTYTIVAEGENAGQVFKAEKVVSFTTLREEGDTSVWYGNIDGVTTQLTNTYNVSVNYSITYNTDKTITVTVKWKEKHPIYGKFVNKTKKYHAHDENNECSVGDTVRLMETRPLSKTKRWRLVEIIEKVK